MIHSMNKKAMKGDSRTFICQGGHTNFIMPTTLKKHKLYWRLFADAPEDANLEDEEMSVDGSQVVQTSSDTLPQTKRSAKL
jgi:hypothetical protein